MYTAKHKLHTARNDTIGLFGFLLSRIFVVISFFSSLLRDQHTNKRKQRIKVERHEEKTSEYFRWMDSKKRSLDIL